MHIFPQKQWGRYQNRQYCVRNFVNFFDEMVNKKDFPKGLKL